MSKTKNKNIPAIETSELKEELDLYNSRLSNLQSKLLTDGYELTRSSDYQDALTFYENEIDAIESELDSLEDDKFLSGFFNLNEPPK